MLQLTLINASLQSSKCMYLSCFRYLFHYLFISQWFSDGCCFHNGLVNPLNENPVACWYSIQLYPVPNGSIQIRQLFVFYHIFTPTPTANSLHVHTVRIQTAGINIIKQGMKQACRVSINCSSFLGLYIGTCSISYLPHLYSTCVNTKINWTRR